MLCTCEQLCNLINYLIPIFFYCSGLAEDATNVEKETMHASKASLDSENEKRVGRSTFFDTLNWNEDGSSGPRPQNGDIAAVKQTKPTNQDRFHSNFASMHEHARPTIGHHSGSEPRESQQSMDVKGNAPSVPSTAPLIDIGLSFDGEQSDSSMPENAKAPKDVFSNYFDDDFANIRSSEQVSNTPSGTENTGVQNIFNSDFSALKIETNLDERQEDVASNSSENANIVGSSRPGVLLNLESTETSTERTSHWDKNMLKSPSTPNFSSSSVSPDILIDTSEAVIENKPARSASLKKNRSANDLSQKYSEDDFFQALGSELSSPGNTSNAHNSFSIASDSVIDPFSVQDEPHHIFDAFAAASPSLSTPMRHSSSEGDLLGDWGHSHTGPTLKPTSAASSTSTNFHRSSSSASDIGGKQNQPTTSDPFDFVNLSTGKFTTPGSAASRIPTSSTNTNSSANNNVGGFSYGPAQQQRSSSPFASSNSFSDSRKPTTAGAGASQQAKSNAPWTSTSQSAPNYYVGKAFSSNSVFGNTQKGGLGGGWGMFRCIK